LYKKFDRIFFDYFDVEMDSPHTAMEALLISTFALGLVMNGFVLRAKKLRGQWLAPTWCISNIISVSCIPLLVITMHRGTWIAGDVMCRLYMATTTLGQWANAWFMIATIVPCTNFCKLLPFILVIFTPTALVFNFTKLIETEKSSHCLLAISSYNDHLWVSLVGYLFSYHTPLTILFCYVFMKNVIINNASVKLQVGLSLAHGILWLPHWAAQLHLLLSEEDSSVNLHLMAVFLTQIHAALAIPTLLLILTEVRNSCHNVIRPSTPPDSQQDLLLDHSRRSSFNVLDAQMEHGQQLTV
jgi:hypothetical protein